MSSKNCVICLMDVTDDDQPYGELAKCKHTVHPLCLLKWIFINPVCPACRTPVNMDFSGCIEDNFLNVPTLRAECARHIDIARRKLRQPESERPSTVLLEMQIHFAEEVLRLLNLIEIDLNVQNWTQWKFW